ncbi:TetR/AcrR family transcriptional regulator [Spongiactinospora sp. TRM90649]|uniref:TetR/AcrR family transcriptional regulator n=1 Tax=Spongiactinospora sp. TRM90649 TaxID=3031114 RepID=UPI0023F6CF47|nr:TetR/AcrR family transcriptional regulator [Spongiactinospora sp. TRM90649]MDF5758035.1 TetR/AcrR family transcriptional regulator [Spongiactinospora sp. TRM90649]
MAPSTRETLVAVAAQLMDEGGLDAVTLREVGRRAGMSHMAPYKHFPDKQALLAAVAARELAAQGAAMSRVTGAGGPPEAIIREVVHGYVAWAMAHPVRFKLVFGTWSAASPELGAAAAQAHAALAVAVVAAQRAGALPGGDPARVTGLLIALAHGAVDLALAGHLTSGGARPADPGDLVDDLLSYLRAAAPSPGGPRGHH